MAKREFVQLAHKYNPPKDSPSGWFMSEKLDGQRLIWDGGITRGMMARDVLWANVEKDKKTMFATGLWTRGGKTVQAPGWWIDSLPKMPLDGELYAGRGNFQLVESVVRDHQPGPEWPKIKFMVFDTPPPENWLVDGIIDNTRFYKKIKGAWLWAKDRLQPGTYVGPTAGFESRLKWLEAKLPQNDVVILHHQERLPFKTSDAMVRLDAYVNEVFEGGGEGAVIKNPCQYWLPERSYAILKIKPWDDAEATVIGYTTGDETDKGSKLLGMMGAIILKNQDGIFKCSGFTDAERKLSSRLGDSDAAFAWAASHPKEEVPDWIHNPRFPRGTVLTYRYRELTDDKLPKEARYHRVRSE